MRWLGMIVAGLSMSALLLAQPALTFPPPKLDPPDAKAVQMLNDRTAQLDRAIGRLRKLGVRDPGLADVEIYLKAARYIAKLDEYYPNQAKWAVSVLEQGLLRAAQLQRGESPWLEATGQTVAHAYRSRIDGSLQPYAVTLPHDYGKERAKRYRIDVVLHGRDGGLTEVKFLYQHRGEAEVPKDQPFIRIDIFGRGNNAYRWAGEQDVFEAVEHFLALETVLGRGHLPDPTRVVLRGFSMGGAGTWHIGLKRPDQFVVIGPGAGFTTTVGYVPKLPAQVPEYIRACWTIYDAVEYAENAFHIPIVAYSGEDDPQIAAARNIETRLKKLGLSMTHMIAPKLGHKFPGEWQQKAEIEYAKHVARGRPEYPDKVRFVTYTLKYPSCHWVEVLGLEQHYRQARVEAERVEAGFQVKTTNIDGLRLALWPGALREPITITIDNQKLANVRPSINRASQLMVYLEKRNGSWESVLPERLAVDRLRFLRKSAGQQGPIDDAFTAPFLCVRGTGTAWHEDTAAYVTADLERFEREWRKYFRGELPVKDDAEVTAEDIAGKHLVLFGDPGSNSLIADVLPRLPLEWTKKEVRFGGKAYDAATHVPAMIYPSPLATGRYVVLNSGHTFHAPEFQGTNALLYPRLGDHAILKLQGDKKTPLSVEVQSAGLFDEQWRVKQP